MTDSRDYLFRKVLQERKRQDELHGEENKITQLLPKNITKETVKELLYLVKEMEEEHKEQGQSWLEIILEEVFETFSETDPKKSRIELIQVTAVCFQMLEKIENGELTL